MSTTGDVIYWSYDKVDYFGAIYLPERVSKTAFSILIVDLPKKTEENFLLF